MCNNVSDDENCFLANFVDSSRTPKSKYLGNERIVFLQINKFIDPKVYNMAKSRFLANNI